MGARIKCLALDHDDTVVMSSPEIHYPSFVEAMRLLRPEMCIRDRPSSLRPSTHGWVRSI